MRDFILPILVLFLLVLIIMLPNIKIVSDNQAVVIERFGKLHKIIRQKGIYVLIPFFERAIQSVDLTTSSHPFALDQQHHFTFRYQVVDVEAFVYYALDSMKSFLTELRLYPDLFNDPIDLEKVESIAEPYGIKIIDFKISNKI